MSNGSPYSPPPDESGGAAALVTSWHWMGVRNMKTGLLVRSTTVTLLAIVVAYCIYYRIGVFRDIRVLLHNHGMDVFWREKAYWLIILAVAMLWAIGSGIYNDYKRTWR